MDFLLRTLPHIKGFLRSIRYEDYFVLIPLLALAVFCVVRLVLMALTLFPSHILGHDHVKTLCANARICYWVCVLSQLLYWFWGADVLLVLLRDADYFAALLLGALALLSLLAAAVQMLFKRNGIRVFTSRKLVAAALNLLFYAAFLGVFAWFLMSA